MKVKVTAEAQTDLDHAVDYLDQLSGRYGTKLEHLAEQAFHNIASQPYAYGLVEDAIAGYEIREYYIHRFQYRVIYWISNESALVVAIIHAKKASGAWHSRLNNLS